MFFFSFCSPGDLKRLIHEIKAQLRKDNYINFNSLTEAFLQYDRDRSGYVDIGELKKICQKQNLPLDDDLMEAVSLEIFVFFLALSCRPPLKRSTQA